jgi:hypothetical protein
MMELNEGKGQELYGFFEKKLSQKENVFSSIRLLTRALWSNR